MKYFVDLDGETLEVELVERNGQTYASIAEHESGAEVPVELVAVRGSGSFSVRVGNLQRALVAAGDVDDLTLIVGSETWHCSVQDEREKMAHAVEGAGGGRGGTGIVRSVMPGVVRDVRVSVGDTVGNGDALLILEAMKMENEIRAEADGTVSAIHVTPGTAVAKGDPLITIA